MKTSNGTRAPLDFASFLHAYCGACNCPMLHGNLHDRVESGTTDPRRPSDVRFSPVSDRIDCWNLSNDHGVESLCVMSNGTRAISCRCRLRKTEAHHLWQPQRPLAQVFASLMPKPTTKSSYSPVVTALAWPGMLIEVDVTASTAK